MRTVNGFHLRPQFLIALLLLGGFIVMTRLTFTGIHLVVSELLEERAAGAAASAALLLDPAWLGAVDPVHPTSDPQYADIQRRLETFRAADDLSEVEVYRAEPGGRFTVLVRAGQRLDQPGPHPGELSVSPEPGLYIPRRQGGAAGRGQGKIGWYPIRDGSGDPVAVVQVFLDPGETLGRIGLFGQTLVWLLLGAAVILSVLAVALVRALERAGGYQALLRTLTAAIDARDPYTQGHSARVSANAAAIARRLGLPARDVERVRSAGVLHDIGKIGVRDAILLKSGKLTPEEWDTLKQHTNIGARIVEKAGTLGELLAGIRYHHERIDGRGYPQGLQGDAIPLDARILAVVDAFDAMTSDRAYQRSRSAEQALAELKRVAGAQVDARLVEVLAQLYQEGKIAVSSVNGVSTEVAAGQMPSVQ